VSLAEDLRYLLRVLRNPNKAVFLVGALVSGLGRHLPSAPGRATVSFGERIMLASPINRRAMSQAVATIHAALVERERRKREPWHPV
jgi:hypothetical protein